MHYGSISVGRMTLVVGLSLIHCISESQMKDPVDHNCFNKMFKKWERKIKKEKCD